MGRLTDAAALVIQMHYRRHLAKKEAKKTVNAVVRVQSLVRLSPAKKKFKALRKARDEKRAATKMQSMARRVQAKTQLVRLQDAARKVRAAVRVQTMARRVKAKTELMRLQDAVRKVQAAVRIQALARRAHARLIFHAMKDAHFRTFAGFATRLQSFGRSFMAKKHLLMHKEARQQRTKAAAKAISSLARDLHVRETMITLNRERAVHAQQRASENTLYCVVSLLENWLIRIVFVLAFSTLIARIMPQTAQQVLHTPKAMFNNSSIVTEPVHVSPTLPTPTAQPVATATPEVPVAQVKARKLPNPIRKVKEFTPVKLLDPNKAEKTIVIEPYYFHA